MGFIVFLFGLIASPVLGQSYLDVEAASRALFDDLPQIVLMEQMDDRCGADHTTNPHARFCTTRNEIYLRRDEDEDKLAYRVAHLMGHAAQVRHGIADIALREVRRRPDEEVALRLMVTAQVECLAGVYLAKAGFGAFDLRVFYRDPPFQDAHWGRNPLRVGPVVSMSLEDRADWVLRGATQGITACSAGEIDVQVLLNAPGYRG